MIVPFLKHGFDDNILCCIIEMMSMTMGGILGAIFGQAQGKDAPNQGNAVIGLNQIASAHHQNGYTTHYINILDI